jgi:hypothetical protein
MANGKLRGALEKALESLEAAGKDLSSIEVTTLSGDVKQIFNGEKIDLKNAVNQLKSGSTSGKIELVAHTHVAFDQDTVLFVSNKAQGKHSEIYDLHKEAVVSAQNARRSFITFIGEFLGTEA